jgi:hypothetical protein
MARKTLNLSRYWIGRDPFNNKTAGSRALATNEDFASS